MFCPAFIFFFLAGQQFRRSSLAVQNGIQTARLEMVYCAAMPE
jgi:hypothetical protein